MNLATNKILIVMLMLLVFASQSMAASVMSCQSNMPTTAMSMIMDTEMHHDDAMPNCEQQSCHCSMGSCSAVVLLSTSLLNATAITSAKKINQSLFSLSEQTLTAIYHPPATC